MIDFSTLQGLTIPEGVVTQITDASGRVLWSSYSGGTFYLRPSADISLGHPVYPTTLSAGYLAINEEVSDGAATYIGFSTETGDPAEATSTFRMSLAKTPKIKKVVSATLVFDGSILGIIVDDVYGWSRCTCNIYIDNVKVFSMKAEHSPNNQNSYNDLNGADMPDLVSALNDYISANGEGNIPPVSIEIYNQTCGGATSDKGTYYCGESYVSQVAIALECE